MPIFRVIVDEGSLSTSRACGGRRPALEPVEGDVAAVLHHRGADFQIEDLADLLLHFGSAGGRPQLLEGARSNDRLSAPRCASRVAITRVVEGIPLARSPLVTVTKLLPSITPLTPDAHELEARGDRADAASGVVKLRAPRGTRVRSTTYLRVLGLGVHSSWMFTDMPKL
jgi:hypothetical protein